MVTGVDGEKIVTEGTKEGKKQKMQEKWTEETGAEGAAQRQTLYERWTVKGGRVNGRRGSKKKKNRWREREGMFNGPQRISLPARHRSTQKAYRWRTHTPALTPAEPPPRFTATA